MTMADAKDQGRFERLMMDDGAEIAAYRVGPNGPRKGGVVLIQEIFGVTTHIREQCDRFAQMGYEVVAPAIFDREAPGLDLGYRPEDVAKAMALVRSHAVERTLADAIACVALLQAAGPVFMTGYCYGGSVTWLAAGRDVQLAAAACYYGSMIPARAGLEPRCPTLVHFGRRDAEIPMSSVETFMAERPEVDVQLYPAGHGFNSDRRADYHHESAELAFKRTIALFDAHSARGLHPSVGERS